MHLSSTSNFGIRVQFDAGEGKKIRGKKISLLGAVSRQYGFAGGEICVVLWVG
jgi:hypothetical protein